MDKIKIGRKEYKIKTGDYVLYNGACYQFCSGDGRALKFVKWYSYSSVIIPKSRLKEIPFCDMKKVEAGNKEERTLLIRWYF